MASANAFMNCMTCGSDGTPGANATVAAFAPGGPGLALRVVERYFGREIAQATATYMEYQGKGWVV